MKKLVYTLLGLGIVIGVEVSAATPTDISYHKQSKTFLGMEYKVYKVQCSNGIRREMTAWQGNKRWCVGKSRQCTDNQLRTARMICRG